MEKDESRFGGKNLYSAPSSPERDGRDLSCVVSSLVQLMIDPHFRSVSGFEALVQKEWVAMGHPFTTRHGLTIEALLNPGEELEQVCYIVCACPPRDCTRQA